MATKTKKKKRVQEPRNKAWDRTVGKAATETKRKEAASSLLNSYGGVSVSFHWFGVTKALTKEQKSRMAELFNADEKRISGGKKLIETKCPEWQNITNIKTRIREFWTSLTLPYVEDGVRLIRMEHQTAFNQQMVEFRGELNAAVNALDERFQSLKAEAREQLGELYNDDDYPPDLAGSFGVEWTFCSIEPPEYLKFLDNGDLFRQEESKFRARIDEAVVLAEAAFMAEFRDMVAHLSERLTGQTDGKPRIFRDSAVESLQTFFERFKALNLQSNPNLDALVEHARNLVAGRSPEELREPGNLRREIGEQLAAVRENVDALMETVPRRRILLPEERQAAGL
jgi:hypothetical protein